MPNPTPATNGQPWSAGDVVALRWVRNDPADVIAPVRIVEHNASRTILFLRAGSPLKVRADADGNRISRVGPVAERERRIARLVDGTWTDNHALMIHEPHRLGAVWLFWREDTWAFNNYYVNLQAPLEVSSAGFDTADYLLDIVVKPDLIWEWKDEDEFEDARRVGRFTDSEADEILAEAERAVSKIRNREWPLGSEWEKWRPDTEWILPKIPENWSEV